MAVDKDAWKKKAEDAWAEFDGEKGKTSPTPDLKSLVSDVKAALKKKQATNSKSSKKAKKAMAKKAKADRTIATVVDKAVAAQDDAEARKKLKALNYQIEVSKSITLLRDRIDLATATIDGIHIQDVQSLATHLKDVQRRVKSAPDGVDTTSLTTRIKPFGIEIGQLATVARDHRKTAEARAKAEKAAARAALVKSTRERSQPRDIPKPASASPNRPGFVGAFQAERKRLKDFNQDFVGPQNRSSFMRSVDKVRTMMGALSPTSLMSAAGRQVGKAANYMQSPASPVVVRALNSIAKGTMATGKAVVDAGKGAMDWLDKRMFGLNRLFSKFFSGGGVSDGFGMLGKLLSGGVFLGAVLKPILEGIDAELKKRFGDNYVEDFITGLWTKAWGYLVKQIRDFLGITEKSDPIGDAGSAHDVSSESKAIMDAATPPSPLTPAQKITKEKALEEYRAELDKGSFMQKFYQIGLNPAQKAAKARYEASLRGELTTTSNTTVTGSTSAAPSTGSAPTTASVPTTTSSSVSPVTPRSSSSPATVTATPVTPPMEGPRSVPNATPAPSNGGNTNGGANTSSSAPSSGAPGASQIPTYASSESLYLMSLNVV